MSKRYPGGIIRKTPQTPSQTSAQGIWDMASVTQAVKENTWPIAGVPDPISRSLRFRSSASAYLNRTPASAGNRLQWTLSFWMKIASIGADRKIFSTSVAATPFSSIYLGSDDRLTYYEYTGSNYVVSPAQVFRDPSAWYHIVITYDSAQATAANRTLMYVNGTVVTAFNSASYVPQNTSSQLNSAVATYVGQAGNSSGYFDGYMTEYYFIDGQALTPSSFGNTNDQTGVWQPIAYTGTYGTNGFYLPFSNTASTATLGYDFSGNSNNWTTNNISLTSGSTYDSMVDVPTQWIPYNTAGDTGALYRGNYCVMSPIDNGGNTLSNGNLTVVSPVGTAPMTKGTFGVSSGKWYWEVTPTALGSSSIGIAGATVPSSETVGTNPLSWGYLQDARKYNNTSTTSYGSSYTTNDVIGVALDMDAGTLTYYKNNISQGQAFSGITGTVLPALSDFSADPATTWQVNFGQRPFSYTPPSGFVTLNTRNLPTPTIGTTSTTQANDYFDVKLYTGDATSPKQVVTGLGFQPDFAWTKTRSTSTQHALYDAVRGAGSGKILLSDTTNAEGGSGGTSDATYGYLSAFNSDGFTTTKGSDAINYFFNNNSQTYVSWLWKANGAGSSNTAGSITSTVSVNTTAGFSIVTYTGTGANATVGHGLGVAPSMYIVKMRTGGTRGWITYHASLGNTFFLQLNATTQALNTANMWQNTTPTSSVFSISTEPEVNQSSATYVAYCFAPVAGYSAFGKYTGNGSSDGPFVFTGFRPRFIMLKASSFSTSSTVWALFDTSRSPYNASVNELYANLSDAELIDGSGIDILSNGFKPKRNSEYANSNGQTYIYMAFAESPFKYALAR